MKKPYVKTQRKRKLIHHPERSDSSYARYGEFCKLAAENDLTIFPDWKGAGRISIRLWNLDEPSDVVLQQFAELADEVINNRYIFNNVSKANINYEPIQKDSTKR